MNGVDSVGVARTGMPRALRLPRQLRRAAGRPLVTTKQEIRQRARRATTAARWRAESLRR